MENIQYRNLQKNDNPVLADVIRHAIIEFNVPREGTVFSDPTTDRLYELFQTPGSQYWVAEENGIVLGGCGIYPTTGLPESCVELVKFFLKPEARGKGIGKALMEKSTRSAQELGYRQIYLETFPELATAITLYERTGFRKIDHVMGNSGHYACNIWMLKDLS